MTVTYGHTLEAMPVCAELAHCF